MRVLKIITLTITLESMNTLITLNLSLEIKLKNKSLSMKVNFKVPFGGYVSSIIGLVVVSYAKNIFESKCALISVSLISLDMKRELYIVSLASNFLK